MATDYIAKHEFKEGNVFTFIRNQVIFKFCYQIIYIILKSHL